MENYSLTVNIVVFLLVAVVTWVAGIELAKTTDTLDTRWKIGEGIGGLVLLGITGSLPELAVIYTAAKHNEIPVIMGVLIGGIAIQTLVVVILDFACGKPPLSYVAGSKMLSIETAFAAIITVLAVVGTMIPAKAAVLNMNPLSIVIVVVWVSGLLLINRWRNVPHINEVAADALPGRKHHQRRKVENHVFYAHKSTMQVVLIFIVASIATLVAGYLLERTSDVISSALHIGSGFFAATFIALVTSLPEISTGLESVWIGDNHLAVSDIMGGNAFMLVLFIFADWFAGKPVLSYAAHTDMLYGCLGIALMGIYAFTFVARIRKGIFRLGVDSVVEIVIYTGAMLFLLGVVHL